MGYRAHIYSLTKNSLNRMKRLSMSKLVLWGDDDMDNSPIWSGDLIKKLNGKDVYSLGEPNWDYKEFKKFLKPCFYSKAIDARYNDDCEFKILTKEGFLYLINFYQEKIITNKKNDLEAINLILENGKDAIIDLEFEKTRKIDSLLMGMRSMVSEWERLKPVDLSNKNKVTDSWKYEYAIFELARIYKNFNFSTHALIYRAG